MNYKQALIQLLLFCNHVKHNNYNWFLSTDLKHSLINKPCRIHDNQWAGHGTNFSSSTSVLSLDMLDTTSRDPISSFFELANPFLKHLQFKLRVAMTTKHCKKNCCQSEDLKISKQKYIQDVRIKWCNTWNTTNEHRKIANSVMLCGWFKVACSTKNNGIFCL